MKQTYVVVWCALLMVYTAFAQSPEQVTIAAAADLKYAMNEMVTEFKKDHPTSNVTIVYGSSGKLFTQIVQGAPFDMFFSADSKFPKELFKNGLCASAVKTYAWGKMVLWSATVDSSKLNMSILTNSSVRHIAIANPVHAPYGQRAVEVLRSLGLYDTVEKKLVYGENIAQAAQFVVTGNAEVGIIALSLAVNPAMTKMGRYLLIPDSLHSPLEQGFVITKRAAKNDLTGKFADFMEGDVSRAIMKKYGFVLSVKI